MALTIKQIPVPEGFPYSSSRMGCPVDTIVLHYTEGKNDDPVKTANTWIKPSSTATPQQIEAAKGWGRKASAHYINPREGDVHMFMSEEWAAWHCPGVNARSIGIENCAYRGELLVPDQELRLVQLCREIMSRHPITRITGHRFATSKGVESTSCPGSLFGAAVNATIEDQRRCLQIWVDKNFGSTLAEAV